MTLLVSKDQSPKNRHTSHVAAPANEERGWFIDLLSCRLVPDTRNPEDLSARLSGTSSPVAEIKRPSRSRVGHTPFASNQGPNNNLLSSSSLQGSSFGVSITIEARYSNGAEGIFLGHRFRRARQQHSLRRYTRTLLKQTHHTSSHSS